MRKFIGLVKIHYADYKGNEYKETINVDLYSVKEVEEALSLYKFMRDNEIECVFNEMGSQVPEEWGDNFDTFMVDDVIVTIGTKEDLWVVEVYLK